MEKPAGSTSWIKALLITALRGLSHAKSYDKSLSIRDAAALLGQTHPQEHHASYGHWVDEAGLIDAVERITGAGCATLDGDTLPPLDLLAK